MAKRVHFGRGTSSKRRIHKMIRKIIGLLLIIVGVIGLISSTVAFGDIGISLALAGIIGILSGIGFWSVPSK